MKSTEESKKPSLNNKEVWYAKNGLLKIGDVKIKETKNVVVGMTAQTPTWVEKVDGRKVEVQVDMFNAHHSLLTILTAIAQVIALICLTTAHAQMLKHAVLEIWLQSNASPVEEEVEAHPWVVV
jgi:hypothetical protein